MIGKRLKELRQHRGLTQEAMAAIARLPRTAIVQIERGKQEMYASSIKRICVALLVSSDWLIGEKAE